MGRGRRNTVVQAKSRALSQKKGLEDPNVTSNQPFVPFLHHITDGCNVKDIDPASCIPLYLSRPRSDNAVKKLKSVINGDAINEAVCDSNNETTLTGFVSGSPTSVVVPLNGDLLYLLDDYFASREISPEDAEVMKAEHSVWYGIVDGCQLYHAIMESRRNSPAKWKSFVWKVFVVNAGLPLQEYRKLAVVQNERSKHANHYESTMFELLKGLRCRHDELYNAAVKDSRRNSVSVTHRDVACAYDGGDHEKNTTIRQAVSVAIPICPRSIDAIGEVVNESCAEIIVNCNSLNTRNLTSTDDVLAAYDCRLFKHFLCLSTLRGASNFINALKEGDEEAQVNTIYRARHWCEANDYKPVKSTVLSDQFRKAKFALSEEAKFLKLLGKRTWPLNMDATRTNLLRSTVFDQDLVVNQGNDQDVLPSLWCAFKSLYPSKAKSIEGRLSTTQSATETENVPENESLIPPQPPSPSIAAQPAETEEQKRLREESEKRQQSEEKRRQEQMRRAKKRQKADSFLTQSGIATHPMTIDEFIKNVWKTGSSRLDLILGTLPSTEKYDEVRKLPALCKSTLKTGSYVVLVIEENQFSHLRDLFTAANFKVCEHTYKVLYDPKTMKRKRNVDFPQRMDDICFIAKSQGVHPSSFVPDFAAWSEDLPSAWHMRFATVQNISASLNKLKQPNQNSPIFPAERSIQLYTHLIRLFCPSEGSVLDPFGGPMTVSLACMKSSRSCITIDRSNPGRKYALGRLRVYATPDATMAKLATFVDDPEMVPSTEVPNDVLGDDGSLVDKSAGNDDNDSKATETGGNSDGLAQSTDEQTDSERGPEENHTSSADDPLLVCTRASKRLKVSAQSQKENTNDLECTNDISAADALLSMTQLHSSPNSSEE